MNNLILIGASGQGREIANRVMQLPDYGRKMVIKGFLVHKKEYLHSLDDFPNYPKIIGMVDDYDIQDEDVFLCTLGDVKEKKKVIISLKEKGAKFYTFIHPLSHVSKDAEIGEGTIILEMATIGSGARIGAFCLIQISAIIAHGNIVGPFSRIDCHVVSVGKAEVGEAATIHTSAVLNHGVKVGAGAVVGACSFVIRNVKPGTTVMGNPAKVLDF